MTPLTDPEIAFRRWLSGIKLRNGHREYAQEYRDWCAVARGEWQSRRSKAAGA